MSSSCLCNIWSALNPGCWKQCSVCICIWWSTDEETDQALSSGAEEVRNEHLAGAWFGMDYFCSIKGCINAVTVP